MRLKLSLIVTAVVAICCSTNCVVVSSATETLHVPHDSATILANIDAAYSGTNIYALGSQLSATGLGIVGLNQSV